MVELKTGDIVLEDYTNPNKFINFFLNIQDYIDAGPFNHAMIYVGEHYDNDGILRYRCLEANFKGVMYREIDPNDLRLAFLRHKFPINQEKMESVIVQYLENIPRKYSYMGLLNASISTILWYLTGKKVKIFKDRLGVYCSEMVAEIYDMYELPICPDNDIVTPNDIYRSKQLRLIQWLDQKFITQ